jgi:short/branched chain acyl-CoA dehydrogenase
MAEAVSKFAQDVIAPKVREMDEAENMDPAIVEQLFEQGLMGIEIPEKYGGAGMNFTAAIIGIEELARVDPSVSVLVDVHNTLVNTAILKYASNELKDRFLPKLASGTVGSFCLSEPVSGSDAFALATKAEKTADGYKISGSKMWITNSMEAGFFIVFANLNPSAGYKGITAFIVEKDAKGFSIAKKEKKLGIKASSTCVLNFDDVVVPKENLLGEEGKGYKYAIALLNEGRIGIAAQMTGLALGAFENAAKYVWNDRKQFGKLVGEFQGMQHQMAQSWTEIAAARALVYNAARKKEAGEDFVQDAAMAKLFASQVAGRVSGLAIEWMGKLLPRIPRSKLLTVLKAAWVSCVRASRRRCGETPRSGLFTRELRTSSCRPSPNCCRPSTLRSGMGGGCTPIIRCQNTRNCCDRRIIPKKTCPLPVRLRFGPTAGDRAPRLG